jgi:hypothetical protein
MISSTTIITTTTTTIIIITGHESNSYSPRQSLAKCISDLLLGHVAPRRRAGAGGAAATGAQTRRACSGCGAAFGHVLATCSDAGTRVQEMMASLEQSASGCAAARNSSSATDSLVRQLFLRWMRAQPQASSSPNPSARDRCTARVVKAHAANGVVTRGAGS